MKRRCDLIYIISFFLLPGLIFSCKEPEDDEILPPKDDPNVVVYEWDGIAESVQQSTIKHFWSAGESYFIQNNTGGTNFNYWWNAHGLDVLVDGYKRTNDPEYLALMNELHAGIKTKNSNTYINLFYDDMEWLALASLRAYDVTMDEKFKATADVLWADIKTGWNELMGGGIAWKKDQTDYKNTPANAPAIILAARLYQLDKNPEDLEWAKKIYAWQKQTLVDPQSGLVWDGINRQGSGNIDKNWMFTYCQGVYIGAGLALYQATNQVSYLNDAIKTADYVIKDTHFSPNGILRDEGGGDGGLFKGIFVRYLINLIKESSVDNAKREEYIDFLKWNGQNLWDKGTSDPAILVGTNWLNAPEGSTDSSTQLSGVMLFEGLAELKKLQMLD